MSRRNKTKTDKPTSYGRDFSFAILLLVSLGVFFNILVLALNYSSGMEKQAIVMANTYAEETANAFRTKMNELRETTNALSSAASGFSDRDDLNNFFYNALLSDGLKEKGIEDIRYFIKNGDTDVEYSFRDGADKPPISNESPFVLDMRKNNVLATYGIIYYETGSINPCLVCYCPVQKNIDETQVIDGIAVFYPQITLLSFIDGLNKDKTSLSEFQSVCNKKGTNEQQILSIINDKSKSIKENNSFESYIKKMTNDGFTGDEINKMLTEGESGASAIYIQNELYILTVGKANKTDLGLSIISLYKAADIYGEGYDLVTSIISTMVVLGVVFFGFALYYIISRQITRKRINEMNMVNATLNCPSLLKYEKDAKEILTRNKATKFAVIISHIHHFNYITETFGDTATTTMLQHVKETYQNALMVEEAYGYVENGEFVLLLHYKDKDRLENRLVSLYAVIKRSSVKDLNGYDLKMCYGIYEVEKSSNELVQRMVEKAMVVKNLPSRSDVNQICHFYDQTVKTDYLNRAEVEGRMEGALASGEFRVFYQPKYNLEKDFIDGAELLVRWYDPLVKKYRRPNEFLPIFEENGFISKLDRHIYYTACETLADRISKGKRIFPISVNVSRVTAIQPDFITYYIKVKNHFKIANGFITLEFTESFAYENYEYLSGVARELRAAGFLCSIDDFGTGYSSYNILKALEMDELKMDKFFLDEGTSPQRDQLIIESVIDISKKLEVKVTQEGVETIEQLKLLKKLGCKVIQGYFFAKPMSLGDYDKFIDDFFISNKIVEALKNN